MGKPVKGTELFQAIKRAIKSRVTRACGTGAKTRTAKQVKASKNKQNLAIFSILSRFVFPNVSAKTERIGNF